MTKNEMNGKIKRNEIKKLQMVSVKLIMLMSQSKKLPSKPFLLFHQLRALDPLVQEF